MKVTSAYVGLNSGGLMTVTWSPGRTAPEADVSQMVLNDVVHGIATEGRFANQLYRPYTVLEHTLLMTAVARVSGQSPHVIRQILFHDVAEGLGVGDIHFMLKKQFGGKLVGVETAIIKALAEKFEFEYPFDPEVKRIDTFVGGMEMLMMHPAKDRLMQVYGETAASLRAKGSPAEQQLIEAWMSREGQITSSWAQWFLQVEQDTRP